MKTCVCINHVTVLGLLTSRGVTVTTLESGTALASFAVEVQDQSRDGQSYSTYLPCEVLGKGAEAAGELQPGTLIYLDGRLKWRRDGDGGRGGTIVVQSWQAQALVPMQPHMAQGAGKN